MSDWSQTDAPLAPGLYIVATPLGHARDITLRALDVLAAANAIYCEDTRVSGKLMARYGIATPRYAYHEHNAQRMRPKILHRLAEGAALALISDAGTPLVSDPGLPLVRAARAAGHNVFAVPGASAPIAALSIAGLATDRFSFAGFLPPKKQARQTALQELSGAPGTLVLFESANRLAALMADIAAVSPRREVVIARELTKKFEEVISGTAEDLAARLAAMPVKGECVVLLSALPSDKLDAAEMDAALKDALAGNSLRDAVQMVMAAYGLPKKAVYARALALSNKKRKSKQEKEADAGNEQEENIANAPPQDG